MSKLSFKDLKLKKLKPITLGPQKIMAFMVKDSHIGEIRNELGHVYTSLDLNKLGEGRFNVYVEKVE